jgi:hypothetical protein
LALALAITLPVAACSSAGAGDTDAGNGTTSTASPVSDASSTTSAGASAGASSGASAGASAGTSAGASAAGGASAPTIDPCSLLSAAAAKSIGLTLGASRAVTTGDLKECVYDAAGPLIVAVLDAQFTRSSFQSLISSQDNGPYASTTGRSAPVPGIGDAAYSYAKTGIVEVLKGSTVASITAANVATAEKVATAVIPGLG